MKYIIGIDSGGTKFLVKAACGESIVGAYMGAPASHHHLGLAGMAACAADNIDACLAQFGGSRADCEAIVCGTTGIDCQQDKNLVEEAYSALPGFNCPITCVNDAEAALYAATGGVGVVVIAGTGSVAFGRDASGQTARSGGWPLFLFGDEGSGTWIARHALRHMSFVLDGDEPESALSTILRGALGLNDHAAMLRLCDEIASESFYDPGIAHFVDEAAQAGDGFARAILQHAVSEAFQLTDRVIKKLQFDQREAFSVGAWGSAITKSPIYFDNFKTLVHKKYMHARVEISYLDAADGALIMARRMLGRTDTGREGARA
ncbi:MAG: N-acetylglucosamine kinase [Oscillospiraceae bacterium]|jgi:N-acetylglucosamine kinase-like BadF-type ATPase|nr:N-acetylglucosamine kinase [Oscillospiraceae bacterium]